MPPSQASGAGAPPDPPRPPRRGIFLHRGPVPEYLRPHVVRSNQGLGNNDGAVNEEPQLQVQNFVRRVTAPSARGDTRQMTDLREVGQFTNGSVLSARGTFSQNGRRGGRVGRQVGLGRGSARNSTHQFIYDASINEAEIQNRVLQNRDASQFPREIRRDDRDDSQQNLLRDMRSNRLRVQPGSYSEAPRTLARSDGAGVESESAIPRMVWWPTSSAGRRGTSMRGRAGRVSDSHRSSNRLPSYDPYGSRRHFWMTERTSAEAELSSNTSPHRREALEAHLRRVQREYWNSLSDPSDHIFPRPPGSPPINPRELERRRRLLESIGAPEEQHSPDSFAIQSPPGSDSTLDIMNCDLNDCLEDMRSSPPERHPDVPTNSPPRSWTNGRPLERSIEGFDDSDLSQARSYASPRSIAFYPQEHAQPNPGEGSSSRPMNRFPGPFFPSSEPPRSMVARGQGMPIADAFGQGGLAASFPNDVTRRGSRSSETEDVARDSRGRTFDASHNSDRIIRSRAQPVSGYDSQLYDSQLFNKLTNSVSRGEGEVTRLGGGESYRPITSRPRSPPRIDSFRSGRDRDNSPRRERARTPPTDSWHPSRDRSPRRRSRTPPRRDRSPARDNWRARPRSPMRDRTPPRRFSPRRDDDRRARSPARRDERRRSRSPYDRDRPAPRARSPLPRRSPPAGPRASYRGRSRTPERRDNRAPTGPSSSNWRRRSPSPPARDSGRSSERTSGTTSRRSSPPIHPERAHLTQAPIRDSRPRSPPSRDRSPRPQPAYRDRDSARSTPRERSPVRPVAPRSPPRGPAGFRAPTGPSGGRNFTAPSPSSAHNAPAAMSIHSRSENTGPVVPPSGPRGYVPPSRGAYSIRGGRGGFGTDRISRPDSSAWGNVPPSRPVAEVPARGIALASRPAPIPSPSIPSGPAATVPTGPSGGIPTGPRAGVPTRPVLQHSTSVYGSRPNTALVNNSGPRPHPAMANLPQIIPGGRIDPTASGIPSDIAARLKRKEEEAELLREELHAKQEKLRQGLKGWDKLSRDSQSMGLRSELSERHVRMLAGEGVGGAAF